MDKVTQSNAAHAEESASSSEDMSAQANHMKSMVDELLALVGGTLKGAAEGKSRADSTVETSVHDGFSTPKERVKGEDSMIQHTNETSSGQVVSTVGNREFKDL